MPLKKYVTIIKKPEDVTVPANGGRRTILNFDGKSGKVKQISFRFATTTQIRLVVKVDGEEPIDFPRGDSIITNHVMTTPYSPQCFFAHKSAASPYGVTSTYEIEFENHVEIIVLNESTNSSAISDAFIVMDVYTEEYAKEKAWAD